MLTFVKDKSATPLVGLHRRSTRSTKPHETVYFTHEQSDTNSNVAPAAGVLALHKDSLKKLHKLSNASFERICIMLDTDEEPEIGDPHRTEYWELKTVFERALRREMYLGDQEDFVF